MVLGVMKGTKLDLHEKLLERNVFTKVRKQLHWFNLSNTRNKKKKVKIWN